jgi:hypothetical protein
VLLLFDFVSSDSDVVVVLKRKLHRLLQGNVARGGRIALLSSKSEGPESTKAISNNCDFDFMSASP